MENSSGLHHRQSIRLHGYDYSAGGCYFLTLCAHERKCLFGHIEDGVMYENKVGMLLHKWYEKLEERFPDVLLDEYVVMPNHFHCILLTGKDADLPVTPLGKIVAYFKYSVSKDLGSGSSLWQRNYYDHIIRNVKEYDEIRSYIGNNPLMWEKDSMNVPSPER